jgi:hypothetical protein
VKIETPPMYRPEAWAASIQGRAKLEDKVTGPGPRTTIALCAIGIGIGAALLWFWDSSAFSGVGQ